MATITVDLKALVGTFVTDIQRASKEAQKAAKEIKDSLVEAGEGGKEGILEAIKSLTGLSPS